MVGLGSAPPTTLFKNKETVILEGTRKGLLHGLEASSPGRRKLKDGDKGHQPVVARLCLRENDRAGRLSPRPHLSLPEEVQFLIALRSRLHVHSHASVTPDSSN